MDSSKGGRELETNELISIFDALTVGRVKIVCMWRKLYLLWRSTVSGNWGYNVPTVQRLKKLFYPLVYHPRSQVQDMAQKVDGEKQEKKIFQRQPSHTLT